MDMNKFTLALITLVFVLVIFGAFLSFDFKTTSLTTKNQGKGENMNIVFEDPEFSFEFIRTLGYSDCGAADVGECISTARRIKDGDFESWYSEWYETALKTEIEAYESFLRGHKVSAREAYLRASSYYRTAEFFLHGNPEDPRILETWGRSRDCFLKVAALSSPRIEPVEIPYENTTLLGYFYRVDESGKPRPLLIVQTGFDGTQEELYYVAVAAKERGYNVLTFEGPGQGRVIREQGLPFRKDWEKVVTPVVNYALSSRDVDPKRIALYGISFGGYLVPRAAAYEHRISAIIVNPPLYDPNEVMVSKFAKGDPQAAEEMVEFMKTHPEEVDAQIREMMKTDTFLRWFIEQGMYVYKVKSPSDVVLKELEFSLKGDAEKIECPTLVCESEGDEIQGGQAREFYDHLRCQKTFILFTSAEGAGEHCQMGAIAISNERILNWLDETFKKTG